MHTFNASLERLKEWTVRHAQGPYATPFLFLFSFAEAIFFPPPVETALIPLVLIQARSWLYYAMIATAGSFVGGMVGYALGFFFYETVGVPLLALLGAADEIEYAKALLSDHVFWATFLAAFTPLPDKVFMPIAGLLHAPLLLFSLALFSGRAVRFLLVGYVTHCYGATAAKLVLTYIRELTIALLALLFVLLVYSLIS